MENPENTNPQSGNKSSRNQYVSAEQLIAKMKVAFTNAKQPEILAELATVGITETQLDAHLADITDHRREQADVEEGAFIGGECSQHLIRALGTGPSHEGHPIEESSKGPPGALTAPVARPQNLQPPPPWPAKTRAATVFEQGR